MKTFIKFAFAFIAVAVLAVGVTSTQAAGYYGNDPGAIINSANGGHATVVTNQTFPKSLVTTTETIYTNVTRISAPDAKSVALQFTAQGSHADVTNTVAIALSRNISGGTPTNAAGTGLKLEAFKTWTVTMAGTTQKTFCTNLTADVEKGAIGNIYITTIAPGTNQNGVVTNYTVYANGL